MSAAVPSDTSDILSQNSEALAGQQPLSSNPPPFSAHLPGQLHKSGGAPSRPLQVFGITSRFVFFEPAVASPAEKRRIVDAVYGYLAARYYGVSVSFGNDTVMHVAYGGHRQTWPSLGGIGPEIPAQGFPPATGSTDDDNNAGSSSGGIPGWPKQAGIGPEVPPGGFKSGSGLPHIGGDPTGPIDGLNPGPVIVGGGKGGVHEDPVAPIEYALLEARKEGVLPEGETWSFGPVVREKTSDGN